MPSESPPGAAPLRVIIADDSPTFRTALESVLVRSGIATVVASTADGDEAIDAFVRLGADLVILDVRMPRMNGLAATAALRRLSTRVRILMVSVDEGSQMEAECLQHGADGFITKLLLNRQLWPELKRLFPNVGVNLNPNPRAIR